MSNNQPKAQSLTMTLLGRIRDSVLANITSLFFTGVLMLICLWGDKRWMTNAEYKEQSKARVADEKVVTDSIHANAQNIYSIGVRVHNLELATNELKSSDKELASSLEDLKRQINDFKVQQATANAISTTILMEQSKALDRIYKELNPGAK
jgi:hypothetical protein